MRSVKGGGREGGSDGRVRMDEWPAESRSLLHFIDMHARYLMISIILIIPSENHN